MIQSFDRATVRVVRDRLQAALDDLAKEIGVGLSVGGARFSDSVATFKVEAGVVGENGVATKAAQHWNRAVLLEGFAEDDLGRVFSSRGVQYRITGWNGRAPKYPVQVERVHDGLAFKFSADVVKRSLKA